MHAIPALTVALPLLGAALLAAAGSHLGRQVVNATAMTTVGATTVLQFLQLMRSWPHDLDVWFGGWTPQHHFAVGILFSVDPIDASLACVVGVLMVGAMWFSWWGMRDVSHLYYALMLSFLGGMSGFCVSGDIFNIFVFFELMSVTGYALCAFRNTSRTVVQGALNFAIVNSIGAFCILMGIAIIYGRTGALNLAEIALKLQGQRPDGLIIVSFVLILVGFLVKAGAVPFHFWLSDAYAVAAAPVGAIYAGIMSDLGYHAIATIYDHSYAAVLGGGFSSDVRAMLVGIGVVTVLLGAAMCYLQADTKRQLAFLVVSHGGIFLCGIGLLTAAGLAGSTMYVAADGMLKGALFLILGYCVSCLGASDELWLRGRGRHRRHAWAGALYLACGVGMAAFPGLGTWDSARLIVDAADSAGYAWLPPVLAVGTAVSAGAVLRAGARIFLGWGPAKDPMLTSSQPDEPHEGEADEAKMTPRVLWPAGALALVGLGLSCAPGLIGRAVQSASTFLDLHGYVAEVLSGHHPGAPARLPVVSAGTVAWAYGAATTLGALAVAGFGLYWRRLPDRVSRAVLQPFRRPVDGLKALHSGRVGDFAAWLTVGTVALCAAGAVVFR